MYDHLLEYGLVVLLGGVGLVEVDLRATEQAYLDSTCF
jgi:hypothetical protein